MMHLLVFLSGRVEDGVECLVGVGEEGGLVIFEKVVVADKGTLMIFERDNEGRKLHFSESCICALETLGIAYLSVV